MRRPSHATSGPTLSLRLFVDDDSPRARRARTELEVIRRKLAPDTVVEIVDIRADPAAAEREHVLAVPALDRVRPPPAQRIIGDLRDHPTVISVLRGEWC
jgi:circadian clock protein KaiB